MFALFCLLAFVSAQDTGCTSATACPDRTTLPVCPDGTTNYIDTSSPCRCWKCRPKDVCVRCPDVTSKPCATGQRPSTCNNCSDVTCCPSCTDTPCPTCPTLGADAAICPPPTIGAAAPEPDCHVCPNCTRPNPCANFDFTKCPPIETLPDCNGANSQPATACCRTCKPPPPCTTALLEACKASFASLPLCASIAAFVFDPKRCCYPCRIPERPPTDPCTPETAAAALAKIPDCQPTEVPVPVPALCSFSCKESGTGCDPGKLTDRTAIPVCPDGVEPVFADCNPNCKPAPPVCSPVCSATQKCVRSEGAVAITTKCIDLDRCIDFSVAGMNSAADSTDVFATIVKRHCEDPTAATKSRCDLFKEFLERTLYCRKTGVTKTDGGITYVGIKCCHASAPPVVGRRLLDSSGLFNDATNNPGAIGTLSFEASQSGATIAGLTGFSALLALFY